MIIELTSATPLYLPIVLAWHRFPDSIKKHFELKIHGVNYETDTEQWKNHIVIGDPFRVASKMNVALKLFPLVNKLAIVSCKNKKFNDENSDIIITHKEEMTTFKLSKHFIFDKLKDNIVTSNIVRCPIATPGYESHYFKEALSASDNGRRISIFIPDTFQIGSFYGTSSIIDQLYKRHFLLTSISISQSNFKTNSYAFSIFLNYVYDAIKNINNDPHGVAIEVSNYKLSTGIREWPMFIFDDREILELIKRWKRKGYFSLHSLNPLSVENGLKNAETILGENIDRTMVTIDTKQTARW